MRSPVNDYLTEVLDSVADLTSGHLADYVSELAEADPDRLAIALATPDGVAYSSGDAEVEFTIQSISKPFVYGMALERLGLEAVLAKVGVEPSGEAFNEISLEAGTGRPTNPMINAGALVTHALLKDDEASGEVSAEDVRVFFSRLAGRELHLDLAVARAEMATAFRNLAIANLLRSYDIFDDDPTEVVRGYVGQCSVAVTVQDLAVMAATLASGGIQPVSGERLFAPGTVRHVLSVMSTCGMYDAAGDWLSTVGIPAKSGVSGGIIGALPGKVGIAVFSPRLDGHGNSVRGVAACERLSRDMEMHLMDSRLIAHTVVRRRAVVDVEGTEVTVVQLQGDVDFATAEQVLRHLVDSPVGTDTLVVDLRHVHAINDVGRRMVLEGVRRLHGDEVEVLLRDPDGVLPDPDAGDGVRPRVVDERDDIGQACQGLDGAPAGP